MNIMLDSQITDELKQRYLLLELDSFWLPGHESPVAAFCVLDPLSPDQMIDSQQWIDLHGNLMHNYRAQNWNYVEQATEFLLGRWQGQLDTFYHDLNHRVQDLRQQTLDASWDGVIDRRN